MIFQSELFTGSFFFQLSTLKDDRVIETWDKSLKV